MRNPHRTGRTPRMVYCTVFPMPFIPFWKILSHHMGPTTRWTAAFELSRTENSYGSLGCEFWPWRHRPPPNLLSCCCMRIVGTSMSIIALPGVGNAGMFEKVILWSICGHFVVDLWSICGQFVVIFRSITGRREYGTVPTRPPTCPSIHQNKLTTQRSMIAILHTEDAEARIIATKRQRPLVSWTRRFTNATSAGETLLPDDPSLSLIHI